MQPETPRDPEMVPDEWGNLCSQGMAKKASLEKPGGEVALP